MSDTTKGLGRGLDALIPGGGADDNATQNEVNINLIDVNPHQPRTSFDEDSLKELSESIKKHGVLQPLVVTPQGDHFELIAGELLRRLPLCLRRRRRTTISPLLWARLQVCHSRPAPSMPCGRSGC